MIRDKLYTKHLSEISSLAQKLDNALENLPRLGKETMEEEEVSNALYRAAEKLNDAKYAIEHFSKSTEEGYLKEDLTGRFVIVYCNGGTSYPLSCGCPLEVYLKEDTEADIEEGWYAGRVEHRISKGYYFHGPSYFNGPGKASLYDGMRVRTRE